MPYVSVTELKRYALTQLEETSEDDTQLSHYLAVATALIDNELGYSFEATNTTPQIVYGDGTPYLKLPADYVSGAVVTAPSGYTVPTYVERDGFLITTDAYGVLYHVATGGLATTYPYYNVWLPRVPYTIAATYGYGATVPVDIKHLCIEIAVMVRKYAAVGGSDVVATETAAVTVRSQLNPLQKAILAAHAASSSDIGVY
jgi:hypothetical protein